MKYLLDTNIFRGLAMGDFCGEAAEIDRRLRAGLVLPFFACDVVFNELVVKLADDPARRFAEVQSYLSWMDRLCGNALIAPSASDVIKCALQHGSWQGLDQENTKRNQLRREILKATAFDSLRPKLQQGIRDLGPYLSSKMESWAAEKDSLCKSLRSMPELRTQKIPREQIIELTLAAHRQSMLGVARRFATDDHRAREAEEVTRELREYSYFEASIMVKALQNEDYNFVKHRNDYHDQMLCLYPAVGYVLVTRDGHIRKNLDLVGCPEPRLATLSTALAQLDGDAC